MADEEARQEREGNAGDGEDIIDMHDDGDGDDDDDRLSGESWILSDEDVSSISSLTASSCKFYCDINGYYGIVLCARVWWESREKLEQTGNLPLS